MRNSFFVLSNRTTFLAIFCVLTIFLVSCNSAQKYIERAEKLATEGNYSDAADNYYTAYQLKPNNLVAKNGLLKNAQLVLDAKFASFAKHVVDGSNEQALRQYAYCRDYFNNLKNIGIYLNWQNQFDDLYEETKNEYISKQYEIGLAQMKENKFDKAEFTFAKILEFDSSYKNVSVLRTTSIVEPLYSNALKNLEVKDYKAAYKNLEQVSKFDPNYKNTKSLLQKAISNASLHLAVVLTNKQAFSQNQDKSFYQVLIARLSKSKNPFLKIIDRNNIESLLKEQEFGMSGIVDATTASKAGQIIGAKYFLLIDVSHVNFDELKPTTSSEIAYESYSERVQTEGGEAKSIIKFKKVNYNETKSYRKVEARVAYQLISVENGLVASSDVFNSESADVHSFAKYNGNVENLYPNLPAGNYMPPAPKEWREKFHELNRNLLNMNQIADNVYQEISNKIIDDINLYINQ